MLLLFLINLAIQAADLPPVRETGIATAYNPFGSDTAYIRGRRVSLCPGKLACSWWGWKAGLKDLFVAHRTLPCGMQVWVRNVRTKKVALATVLDRGTFGAVGCHRPGGLRCVSCDEPAAKPGWCLKINKHSPGRWRGIADLSTALVKAISHNGREKIQILYTKAEHRRAAKEWQRRKEGWGKEVSLLADGSM